MSREAGPRPSRRGWILGGVLLILGLVPVYAAPTNSDLAWYQYAAGRLLEGAALYRDLVEVNPPLIVWLNLPAVLGERLLGLSASRLYPVWVVGLAALSISLIRAAATAAVRALRDGPVPLLALLVLALVTLPGSMFVLGQREHLLVVLAAPYLALAAARLSGESDADGRSRCVALAAGAMAGVGFALKPHFVLLLVAVEALVATRGRWRPAAEALVAAGTIGVYGIAVALFLPEAVGVARRFAPLYTGLRQMDLAAFLTRWETLFSAAALVAWFLAGRSGRLASLGRVLSVFVVVALALAWLQGMGWSYHFAAAVSAATLLAGAAAAAGRREGSRIGTAGRWAGLAMLALLAVRGGQVAWRAETSEVGEEGRIESMASVIDERAPAGTVVVLSPQISSAFPLVNRTGVRWGMRYPSLWVLTATAARGRRLEEARRFRREVVSDLTRNRPDLIIVDRREGREAAGGSSFDYLEYFRREEEFMELMEAYRRAGDRAGYTIYERAPGG